MHLKLRSLFLIAALTALFGGLAQAQSSSEETQGFVSRTALPIFGGAADDLEIASNGNLYAAFYTPNGIFCSADGAETWKGFPAGSNLGHIYAVTVGETPDTVYVHAGNKLYKSSNACKSFNELKPDTASKLYSTGFTYAHGHLLIGHLDGSVEVSTDNGNTFTKFKIEDGLSAVISIAPAAAPNTFYALAEDDFSRRLFRSVDGGQTWNDVFKSGYYSHVAVDPQDDNIVVLSSEHLVDISTDGGLTWTDVTPTGLTKSSISFISVPGESDRIFVGKLFTTDLGTTWTDLNSAVTESDSELLEEVLQDPADENTYYIISKLGVAKSTDKLATWQDSVQGILATKVGDIAQTSDKNVIYFAGQNGLAKATNYLADNPAWLYPLDPSGSGASVNAVHLPDPSDSNLVIVESSGTIYRSADGGKSWTPVSVSAILGLDGNVSDFAQTKGKYIYAGYQDLVSGTGGVMVSDDRGASWTDTALPHNPIVNAVLAVGETVFAGVGDLLDDTVEKRGIYRLSGNSWSRLTGPVSGKVIKDLIHNGTSLFAAAEGEGVYRSTDNGDSWVKVSDGFPKHPCVQALTFDPELPSNIYAAHSCTSGAGTIYKSINNGQSWSLHYKGAVGEVPWTLHFSDGLIAGLNNGAFKFTEAPSDRPQSPVYTLWNVEIGMINILELVNFGDQEENITVTFYDSRGKQKSQHSVKVGAKGQFDLILNGLEGFSGGYGTAKVEFSSSNIDGRMFYYLSEDDFRSYKYAFAIPFSRNLSGTSYVAFNTNNPTPANGGFVVNWLSLVNLDPSDSKTFTVNSYELSELRSTKVEVPPLGRIDIDGGVNGVKDAVGFNEIIPEDASAPYQAINTRYGFHPNEGYFFAFPLVAKTGSDQLFAPMSRGAGAINWLELYNLSDKATVARVTLYDNAGNKLHDSDYLVGARRGRHMLVSEYLPEGQSGVVKITDRVQGGDTLIAQNMFYFRDAADNLQAMYGSQADNSLGGSRYGTYNLFLGMYNWLRIFNTSDNPTTAQVTVYGREGVTQREITLGAHQGIDLGLHETDHYGTAPDTYGVFSVSGPSLLTELLRIRGAVDFAAPTAVRR